MSLDLLRLQVSSGLVVAARHWRRICHVALTGYGISEACAAPLLMIVRLGDGVHQVAVAQAAGLESPSLV
ncbi:MAG TPA: MarR family transcriptional regulator, partial [Pseudomonas sp.]|nr:MarR family transcriptional regulator [Pseudomonas sp.]